MEMEIDRVGIVKQPIAASKGSYQNFSGCFIASS